MKRTVLTFGLISGAILSIMMAASAPFMNEIGFERGEVIGYSSMVLAFLLVFFGVRSYRDNVAGGSITFGRAFVAGALIVAVASVCYVATWQVVSRTTARDFVAQYQAHLLEQDRARGASEAALAERRAELQRWAELYRNPLYNVAFTFIEPLPVGLVLALVSAGILRRRRDSGDRVTTPRTAVSG
jgi:hypothetical protein